VTGLLEGKTAVVTGGSSGIGLASAERTCSSPGGNPTAVVGDVNAAADVDSLYGHVRDRGHRTAGRAAGLNGVPGMSAYGASKAAVRADVRRWAKELSG
jgi:NAD(P)-dependent dehydrogenase (short-subunit alcohol dehydrogenase family)